MIFDCTLSLQISLITHLFNVDENCEKFLTLFVFFNEALLSVATKLTFLAWR